MMNPDEQSQTAQQCATRQEVLAEGYSAFSEQGIFARLGRENSLRLIACGLGFRLLKHTILGTAFPGPPQQRGSGRERIVSIRRWNGLAATRGSGKSGERYNWEIENHAASQSRCLPRFRIEWVPRQAMKILVVDDEKIKRVTLADDLATQGHEVVVAADGEEALEKLAAGRFDVVVTDLKMPKLDGIELLKRIKQGPLADDGSHHDDRLRQHSRGGRGGQARGVRFSHQALPQRRHASAVARIERQRQAAAGPRPAATFSPADVEATIVGHSAAIERVRRMVEICAKTDANVLLCGETGVGKDLLATIIHRNSHRHGFPYVKVGCTLFPPQLIESELYGHEKGSFTGAEQQRKGRFDLAEGGTLYLDDVDDIPLEQQPKLLRAIEEKVFERVGGGSPIKANVRIVASTKRNLLEKIAEGTFREDLYYRLDVLRINIPPLRERLDDVPLLAEHLLETHRRRAPLPDRAGRGRIARRATIGPATSASCTTRWSGRT